MLTHCLAPSGSTNGSCWHAGEPCLKLKRAAEAVAEALAQPNPDSEAGKQKSLPDPALDF